MLCWCVQAILLLLFNHSLVQTPRRKHILAKHVPKAARPHSRTINTYMALEKLYECICSLVSLFLPSINAFLTCRTGRFKRGGTKVKTFGQGVRKKNFRIEHPCKLYSHWHVTNDGSLWQYFVVALPFTLLRSSPPRVGHVYVTYSGTPVL
jgi:hypothetical protein